MKTEYLKLNPYQPERESIEYAVRVIKEEGLVVLPTETVYGIGFDPESEIAWQKIREIKREREQKPYALHLASIEWLKNYDFDEYSLSNFGAISDLLPGPITFILGLKDKSKLGFRIPNNLITQKLIFFFSKPIYLPSANISGGVPARGVQEVIDNLWGKVDLILDGGSCQYCILSCVLDLTQNPVKILRAGPPFVTEEIRRRFNI